MKVAAFEKELYARSSTKSSQYAQWLSMDQVTEMLAPEQDSLDLVLNYVASFGVQGSVNTHRDTVTVLVPGPVAEKMVATPLYHYRSKLFKKVEVVRVAGPYSLPAEVAE